jgi:hypothetical protein
MKELHELKEMLCDELKEYGKKDLTAGSLDVIDKLSHALKSIETIIAMEEADEEYSGIYRMPRYYRDGYDRNGSYARNGRSYRRRDSMGRYSREDGYSGAMEDMADQLREIMKDAPDESLKKDIRRILEKVENM